MKSSNGHTGTFDQYLTQFRQRFRLRTVAIGVAALVFTAVLISLVTLVLGEQLAYSPLLYIPARIVLGLFVLGIIAALLWLPLRAFARTDGIAELEQRVPELQGRAETYDDLNRKQVDSPFSRLLARDAMRAASGSPMHKLLPKADVYGPLVAAGFLIVLAGWLYSAVPLNMRAGMAHLWLGWFKTDILPERIVTVTPGDSKIRYGDSFTVNATLSGFESAFAALHIREQDGDWNELEMTPDDSGRFGYTLYGVTSPLEYFVSSAFTNSDTFSLEVVVPARIESLDLEYHFPEWTGAEPELVENGSQIAAVAGTRVDLIFSTDRALRQGILVHDNTTSEVTQTGDNQYRASLLVKQEGEYQLADLFDDDRIPLSDKQPIIVLEDALPEISFVRPGADWNASPIEEVTVSATANDDFAVERVDLHYSVNGEAWQTIALDPDTEMEHVFYLEDFGSDGEALVPGDLISYYAEAHDREQSVSTDMLFIDVRPFDRRFSQSQQAGGGGGSGSQAEQEISQRQKEILVATWNLIREERENTRSLIKPEDSAALLADLQSTLAGQADTLAQRADARQLLDDDPDIARFVEYMKEAATAMQPSAQSLAALEFDEAVKHQQRALQYLKRAESVFNDIRVSRNQSGGGGGGGNAGRDMAEMYELEMDLAKNQYETPDAAQQSSNATQNEQDDAFDRLKDLARRQQKLAEAAQRNEELSMAERWQQERLQRELEELQRELERQQQSASQNSQQQNAQQQQSGQQQSGQQQSSQQQSGQQSGQQSSGQQNANRQTEQGQDQQNAEAMQNLQQALEQLRGSQDGERSAEEMRQALESASRELQESVERINQSRQQQLREALTDAVEQTRDLTRQQRETAEQLRDALERAMSAREQGVIESGLEPQQEVELAEQKRQMQRDLEDIREQLGDAAERFRAQNPDTTERIDQALNDLEERKISELLGISGDMIEEGRAPQAALREQQITEALTDLQNNLLDSASIAEAETGAPVTQERTVADASRALQQMREALNQAMQRGQAGDQTSSDAESGQRTQQAQQSGSQSGQQGQQQNAQQGQSGQQQGGGGDGQQQSNQLAEGGQRRAGSSAPGGGFDLRQGSEGPLNLDNLAPGDSRLVEEARRELADSLPDLQNQLSAQMLESLQQIARDLQPGESGENERRINREVGILLRQIEQLELALNRSALEAEGEGIRTARGARDPSGYSSQAAEYFRRLSEGLSSGS
jgi:hypothetical protein